MKNTWSVDKDIEDHTSPLPRVTLKKASSSLEKLSNLSLQTGVNVKVFEVLFTLENCWKHGKYNEEENNHRFLQNTIIEIII